MLIYQIAVFNAAKVIIMKQYSKYFASQHGIFPFFLTKYPPQKPATDILL